MDQTPAPQTLLEIRDLSTHYIQGDEVIPAVRQVSLSLKPGQTVGLVGESGCGKSALALSIMGLIPKGRGTVEALQLQLLGRDLLRLKPAERRRLSGLEMSMIFQEPSAYLNPVMSIGPQVAEPLLWHGLAGRSAAHELVIATFREVGLPDPERRYHQYPFEMSGGQLQRVLIAMAVITQPKLLIADEPTTALDVSVQAEILRLLKELQQRQGMAMLFITHDMALVSQVADWIAVMYGGRIVEQGPAAAVFQQPLHPYSEGLLGATAYPADWATLPVIPGQVPDPRHFPQGCAFHPRCPRASNQCLRPPPETRASSNHHALCWHPLHDAPVAN